LCAAPLPGTVVARFDHQTGLFDRAYAIEDAHAHESSVLDRAVEDLSRNDLVIADRHYCIVQFLAAIAARCGFFLIRQHGRLKGKLLGNRKRIGKIDSGVVYEQALEISDGEHTLEVCRITLELAEPTREGDRGKRIPCVDDDVELRSEVQLFSALRIVSVLHGDVCVQLSAGLIGRVA